MPQANIHDHITMLLCAMLELSEPRVRVGSDLEFGRTWLQQAGCCADLSFMSGISGGQRARHEEQRQEGKRGRKLQVRSGQDFTAMIFDN